MTDIVDRVAEAIALASNGGTWENWYNEDQREFHRKRARAAIDVINAEKIRQHAMTWQEDH